MKVFVYHTPELAPEGEWPDCAIAVDVLRATTTIATALAHGAEAVQVFSDMAQLMAVSEQWAPEQRVRAGERGGSKVEGCDLGNSPLDCTPELMKGRRLFISTTNGTRCLTRIQKAATVLTAALINRHAVVNYLTAVQPETVWIVGSGWEGSFSLEDTICAGAISYAFATVSGQPPEPMIGNDEVVGAIALYTQWKDRLLELMHYASHGQRLLRLHCHADLEYCVQMDSVDVLPIQQEPGVLVRYVA